MRAAKVDNGSHGTIIGQIHIDGNFSQYPVAKLYYASSGDLNLGVEESVTTGGTAYNYIGNVPLSLTVPLSVEETPSDLARKMEALLARRSRF